MIYYKIEFLSCKESQLYMILRLHALYLLIMIYFKKKIVKKKKSYIILCMTTTTGGLPQAAYRLAEWLIYSRRL